MGVNVKLDGIRAATQAMKDFAAAYNALPQDVKDALMRERIKQGEASLIREWRWK